MVTEPLDEAAERRELLSDDQYGSSKRWLVIDAVAIMV